MPITPTKENEAAEPGKKRGVWDGMIVLVVALLTVSLLDAGHLRTLASEQSGIKGDVAQGVMRPLYWASSRLGIANVRTDGAKWSQNTLYDGIPVSVGGGDRAHAVRVLLTGDSIMANLVGPITGTLYTRYGDSVAAMTVQGGEMGEPGIIDWPTRIREEVATYNPDVVLIENGPSGRNVERVVINGHIEELGSPGWSAWYAGQVRAMVEAAHSRGAKVVWVNRPYVIDPGAEWVRGIVEPIEEKELARVGGTMYHVQGILDQGSHSYQRFLVSKSGSQLDVRDPDGEHFSPLGARIVAGQMAKDLASLWQNGKAGEALPNAGVWPGSK